MSGPNLIEPSQLETRDSLLAEGAVCWRAYGGNEIANNYLHDPQENVNIVDFPEYKEKVKECSVMLRSGWRAVLPE